MVTSYTGNDDFSVSRKSIPSLVTPAFTTTGMDAFGSLPPPKNWLGLIVRDPAASDRLKVGVIVAAIESGSPAQDAGLRSDDAIVEINFAPIRDLATFNTVRQKMAGYAKPALFRVIRGRTAFYTAVGP